MTFWCAGFRNVISAYGVNGFSQDHWQALKHHGTQRVIIAFDRDSAGDAAAEKLAEELRSAGIEVFRLLFPQGMDANAFALQVENPTQALGELLQQALWQGKGTPVPVESELTFSLAAAPQAAADQQYLLNKQGGEHLPEGGAAK
ncbi:toprim domain-containing protein, partial [Pseudomonas amygdali]|uniref:toprim domain-containing protein n=1 Tax=Pseudomonas amygdali TaxID=47877 RepID=UPI000ABF9EE6